MANNAIRGKDVLMEVYDGSAYVPFICSTDCTINIRPELIDKTTLSSGRFPESQVRRIPWSVDISGVTDMLSAGWDAFDTVKVTNIIAGYQIRLTFTDPSGNTAVFTGKVFLENASITGDVSDFSTWENTLRGSGAYTLVVTIGGVPVDNARILETGETRITESGDTRIII